MNEVGLAQSMAPQENKPMQDVNQIVMLLKQGMTPEELVEAGIPVELVQAAMEMVSNETTQIPPERAGLAGMMTQGDMRGV